MTATTVPADGRCVTCREPMRLRSAPPAPGTRVHEGHGRCRQCFHVARYERRSGKARQVPRDVLVAEVTHMRRFSEAEHSIATRLGMKPLSYRRALYRAGLVAA